MADRIGEMMALRTIAYARSGDKGNSSNIGIIAHDQESYKLIENYLTEERVAEYFYLLCPKKVTRYALPNLLAFNFVLEGVLGEGGSRSLRLDAQGKGLGQLLLEMPIPEPGGNG